MSRFYFSCWKETLQQEKHAIVKVKLCDAVSNNFSQTKRKFWSPDESSLNFSHDWLTIIYQSWEYDFFGKWLTNLRIYWRWYGQWLVFFRSTFPILEIHYFQSGLTITSCQCLDDFLYQVVPFNYPYLNFIIQVKPFLLSYFLFISPFSNDPSYLATDGIDPGRWAHALVQTWLVSKQITKEINTF